MLCLKIVHVKVAERAVPKHGITEGSESSAIVYKAGAIRGCTTLRRLRMAQEVKCVAPRR
jgi:hypothetical protein